MNTNYSGEIYFLSPHRHTKINIEGFDFKSAQSALESFKNLDEQKNFQDMLPTEAKKFSDSIDVRKDWNEVKDHLLYRVQLAKFEQNKLFKDKLKRMDVEDIPNDELGNILNLVRNLLISNDSVAALIKEQETSFNWDIVD